MHPLLILFISIVVVFVLIIRLKINAFAALITAAILIGLLSPGIALTDVMSQVGSKFGNVVGRIGIAIAMAALVGQCLMESGAADKITRTFVRWFGEKYSSLSMVASGYVLAVPVFADTVFYLLIPLARAMSVRMGGRQYLAYAIAISSGGAATHVFVPPTPGPLAMAATMNIDLGIVILVGLAVALPSSLAGWAYGLWIDRKLNIPVREAPGLPLDELAKISKRDESELPGFLLSLSPILLPVVLITANTVTNTVAEGSELAKLTAFLGDPSLALMFAAAVSLWLLASQNKMSLRELAKPAEEAIKAAGLIILITAGGGAFGGMLVTAGVGDYLGQFSERLGLSYLILGFLLSVLIKIAQGSATVCMITVSAIMAPLLVNNPPDYHPVYVLMTVGSGSLVGAWMNDSGFWVFKTMTGLTEIESLQTKTASLMVLGFTGLFVSLMLSWLLPLV